MGRAAASQLRLPRAPSNLDLIASRDGAPTASLGSCASALSPSEGRISFLTSRPLLFLTPKPLLFQFKSILPSPVNIYVHRRSRDGRGR